MRAPYAGLLAGVCVGVTAAAEIGTVLLGWELQPAYTSVLFGLYNVTIVVIGALIAVRYPRNPVGWILAGFGTQTAVLSDFVAAYGHRASLQGWPADPVDRVRGLVTRGADVGAGPAVHSDRPAARAAVAAGGLGGLRRRPAVHPGLAA
jgi:hypothetical protein